MNKLKIIRIISDSVIVILMILGLVFMIAGIYPNGAKLVSSGFESLRFFTVQSNIFMGVMSLVSLFFINKKMPLALLVIKYVACCTVTLTFLTVMTYLGPVFGMLEMLNGPNLFMHLLLPVVAIAHIIFIEEKIEKPKFYYSFYSIVPMFVYGIFYLTNVAVNNGYGNAKYDWYLFGSWGIGPGIGVFFLMMAFAYLIGIGVYFGYTKVKIKNKSTSN